MPLTPLEELEEDDRETFEVTRRKVFTQSTKNIVEV